LRRKNPEADRWAVEDEATANVLRDAKDEEEKRRCLIWTEETEGFNEIDDRRSEDDRHRLLDAASMFVV